MKRFFLLMILLAGVMPQIGSAQKQDELEALLVDLDEVVDYLHANDWLVANIYIDRLTIAQPYRTTRQLFEGNEYVIVGVGGAGIQDLDIKILDEKDTLLDEDVESDNVPLVELDVKSSGFYYIETSIYELEARANAEDEYFFMYIIAFKAAE